jgi:hypothetical protein
MKKTEDQLAVDKKFGELLNSQSLFKLNIIRLYSDKYLLKEELKEINKQNEEYLKIFYSIANFFMSYKKAKQNKMTNKELIAYGIKQ